MYKNINDYELLYLVSENNEEAYNDIYSKYSEIVKIESNKLFSKCKYLGVSKEDLYQAGLYGFDRALNNFSMDEGTLFFTYAKTYISRELQTFIRDKSRNKHNLLSDCISLDMEIDDDGNNMFDLINNNENTSSFYESYINCKKILDLKYCLSSFDSLVFELRLNNFNNQEISILLDTKYKTIDNSLRKIKNIIKKELNKIELF